MKCFAFDVDHGHLFRYAKIITTFLLCYRKCRHIKENKDICQIKDIGNYSNHSVASLTGEKSCSHES